MLSLIIHNKEASKTCLFQATGVRIAMAIQSLTGMVAGVVIAFVYDWKLALVVMGTLPLMGFACIYLSLSLSLSLSLCVFACLHLPLEFMIKEMF